MTDRERLTVLLLEGHKKHLFYDKIADYLLANDVIKVVKCKDCEFVEPTKIKLNGKDLRICGLYKRPCFDNDFCSRGVLKE